MNRRPEMIFPLFFIPLSPSNLRPFGAPPSIGRRECPREPLPLEGAAERSEAGLASFLRRSRLRFAFPIGEGGTASAVDRVLSYIVDLRRSFPLFFIPLVPYPARSARHLPHAGKAVSVVILFLHVSCIRFDGARKAVLSFRSLPHYYENISRLKNGAKSSPSITFPLKTYENYVAA